ncbi:MAG: hypothetical protein JNM27_14335 [Leptospirales bacterium]|nr:hypothetical protein [Leptospirales bacterium]
MRTTNRTTLRIRRRAALCGTLLFSLFLPTLALYARQMIILDGSNNRYRVGQTLLFYDPVTPAESSSGLYSGGEPAAFALKKPEQAKLSLLLDRCFQTTEGKASERVKGSYLIQETKDRTVILQQKSKLALELDLYLKHLRGSSTPVPVVYKIDRHDNPWQGMTDTAAQEERNRTIRAMALPGPGFKALTAPSLLFQGTPILYRNDKAKEVGVDQKAFSQLDRPDATRLNPGEQKRIGAAQNLDLLNPSFLLPFLLSGQIVTTYWHTDAELRLNAEETHEGRVCYQFHGEHHYYTNQKNTRALRFAICTDTGTREIFIKE